MKQYPLAFSFLDRGLRIPIQIAGVTLEVRRLIELARIHEHRGNDLSAGD